MTREEKIRRIKTLARKMGVILLSNEIKLSCGEVDIIQVDGVSKDMCGDWVLVGSFGNCDYCPILTDDDITEVYCACLSWANKIMKGDEEDWD